MKETLRDYKILKEDGYIIGDISFEDGIIKEIKERNDVKIVKGIIIPGFIDEHTHGGMGYDFTTIKNEEEGQKVLDFYLKNGVTSCLPTLLTERDEVIFKQLELLYKLSLNNKIIKGIHIEGPFISKKYKGAQLEECIKEGNKELVDNYISHSHNLFKLMTLAPEVTNAEQITEYLVKNNIQVTMGHSDATQDDTLKCLRKGAKNVTHLFNAMKGIHHHFPSISSCALMYDELYCEVILDLIHVNKDMVKFILKCKTPSKVIGVTDSLMAAGLEDGEYKIGETPIIKVNGDCLIKETGVRAGSSLTMLQAFYNLKNNFDLTDLEISNILSLNCAKFLKIDEEVGSLKEGKKANFIIFDNDYNLVSTFLEGEKVYG